MNKKLLQYYFPKESIKNFRKDLQTISEIIANKNLLEDKLLEIMAEIISIKEHIEYLEKSYLNKYQS
jgi:hypothetical protein